MRRVALTSLTAIAALALTLTVGFPSRSAAQSPPVAVSPAPSPWQAQAVVIVQLTGAGGGAPTAEQVVEAETVVRARLAALGGPGASVRSIPDGRLRIDVADEAWAELTRQVAVAPGDIQFVPVPNQYASDVVDGEPLPVGMPVAPLFGSEGIAAATLGSDMMDQPSVDLTFTPEAAAVFDEYAAAHFGERFAMVLDDVVLVAPTINARVFDGQAQISGAFDVPEVSSLIAILQGGVLPVSAEILTVCPATGECPTATSDPVASPEG